MSKLSKLITKPNLFIQDMLMNVVQYNADNFLGLELSDMERRREKSLLIKQTVPMQKIAIVEKTVPVKTLASENILSEIFKSNPYEGLDLIFVRQ